MSHIAPEFSRLVPLTRLGPEPFRQRIEATADERAKLLQRLDVLALDRLVAEVELRRQSSGVILLEAAFEAEFEQCCVATLDPVRGAVAERFSLVYGAAEDERELALEIDRDEPAFEPLAGNAIDIGEAVTQELSLVLPEFPRHPEAAIDDVLPDEPMDGPFAGLARLQKPMAC